MAIFNKFVSIFFKVWWSELSKNGYRVDTFEPLDQYLDPTFGDIWNMIQSFRHMRTQIKIRPIQTNTWDVYWNYMPCPFLYSWIQKEEQPSWTYSTYHNINTNNRCSSTYWTLSLTLTLTLSLREIRRAHTVDMLNRPGSRIRIRSKTKTICP